MTEQSGAVLSEKTRALLERLQYDGRTEQIIYERVENLEVKK